MLPCVYPIVPSSKYYYISVIDIELNRMFPMPTTDDAPDRLHPNPSFTAARIGELLRLHLWLDQTDLDLAAVRAYVADRLERLYPLDYHVYRRRWHGRGPDGAPGPLLSFLEWWPLMQELTERATVAAMVGEVDGRVGELRRVLLVG